MEVLFKLYALFVNLLMDLIRWICDWNLCSYLVHVYCVENSNQLYNVTPLNLTVRIYLLVQEWFMFHFFSNKILSQILCSILQMNTYSVFYYLHHYQGRKKARADLRSRASVRPSHMRSWIRAQEKNKFEPGSSPLFFKKINL